MNSISQIKQVFPEELLKKVKAQIDAVPWKYGWASNRNIEFTHWNYDFGKAGSDNGLDISHRLPPTIKEAWDFIQATHIGPQTLLRCYTNSHTFGVEGYPHTDSRRPDDYTIVVYMTPEWQRNWGGETTVYEEDTIIHAELPKYNDSLIFRGNQWHCARAVTRICPAQRITLMFKFAKPHCDVFRDNIQRLLIVKGADKIKHSGRKLSNHLLSVYDTLKSRGHDQTTASVGGLHSIFGTNAFKHKTMLSAERSQVVEAIGEEATVLVELFRDIKRPSSLESALKAKTLNVTMNDGTTKSMTEKQLNILCAVEAANLSDQKSLKNYPEIAKFLRKN